MAIFWNSVAPSSAMTKPAVSLNGLGRIAAWFSERRARTQTLRELSSMDERDLRDLRITPYDFNEIANGTYRR